MQGAVNSGLIVQIPVTVVEFLIVVCRLVHWSLWELN